MGNARPRPVSVDTAAELGSRLLGLEVSARELYGEFDLNFELRARGLVQTDEDGAGHWVLKLTADDSSQARDSIELQAALLRHLQGVSLQTELPRVVVPRPGEALQGMVDEQGNRRWAWILSWVEGALLDQHEHYDETLLESLGVAVAEVDRGLTSFEDARAERVLRWDSLHALEGLRALDRIDSPNDRRLAAELFEVVSAALPRLGARPRSVIHNDGGNQHNMLVRRDSSGQVRVTGMIDFGDALRTVRLCGLGIAAAYATFGVEHPVHAICSVSKGYAGILPLEQEELELLVPLVLTRLLTTVSVAAERRAEDPGDSYASVSEEGAWRSLRALHAGGVRNATGELRSSWSATSST